MKKITIYTDGACSNNPGPGGWGAILIYNSIEKEIYGFVNDTTNNRMELQAAIEGLKIIKEPASIQIFTDSQYVKNGITQWIFNWQKNNWKTSDRKEVKNKEMWMLLLDYCNYHQVTWNWVKGHSDDVYNERVDKLARRAIQENFEKNSVCKI